MDRSFRAFVSRFSLLFGWYEIRATVTQLKQGGDSKLN